jgi:ubiquinone/menaquinone biosynthesis C-methylase UbiE
MDDQKYFKRFIHFHHLNLNNVESFKVIKKLTKNKKTLDVGCGLGHLANFWDADGVDISDLAIKKAKETFPKRSFYCASADHLPYKKSSYDCIVCYNVLEHIPNKQRGTVYKEIKRVIKKGGFFIAAYIDESFWLNRLLNFIRPDKTHLVSWSPSDFKKEISSQFKIIDTKKTSCYGRLHLFTKGLKGEIIFKCLVN